MSRVAIPSPSSDDGLRTPTEERVLLLTSLPRDAQLMGALLTQGAMAWHACRDLPSLCAELFQGAGAVLITQEELRLPEAGCLAEVVTAQPEWSEIPFIILTRAGRPVGPPTSELLNKLGNVTLLERPVGKPTLRSAVQAALRARRHQYRVRAHLAEQARLVAEIRRADQAKDHFLAMLAHELRNPLAPILTVAHLLKGHAAANPELERLHNLLERQARNMSRLVEDLLDVSRITQGKVSLRKERLELGEVTRHALEAVRPLVEERRHQLHTSGIAEPLVVDADRLRLEQIVLNLVVNAAKYTEPGGTIEVILHREGDTAVLSVKDTGDGIPPELLPHVFELFTQAERTLDRSQGGLGIGLTMVRRLVEMHGGTIHAFSSGVGHGSEFTVRLPIAGLEVVQTKPVDLHQIGALNATPRLVRGACVLVIDDNRDSAESIAELVQCWGYEVHVAGSGAVGLVAATEYRPGVILLDIGMPGLNGFEVARRLRDLPETREATLVALTGYGQEEYRQLSREAGFDYHLVKPVDPEVLRLILAKT